MLPGIDVSHHTQSQVRLRPRNRRGADYRPGSSYRHSSGRTGLRRKSHGIE
jgi:hypothetical protein